MDEDRYSSEEDQPEEKPSTSQGQAKRIEIRKLMPVAGWSYELELDICAICRNENTERCIQCQAARSEEECATIQGNCKHIFHKHCIARWLEHRNVCPLDNQDWTYASDAPPC
ncbi:RING-box protein 1A-like [Teleopsis dalmanni]|uniref:RING-box protein 1A-like n=1 Tax=Teleopsis dalmanni TaxID=139649 RepID=UPI000D32AA0F|nr:RING-box protein 1A-like [Teleopsis dalmanni]